MSKIELMANHAGSRLFRQKTYLPSRGRYVFFYVLKCAIMQIAVMIRAGRKAEICWKAERMYTKSMKDKIVLLLRQEYGIDADVIKPLSGGVGGDTCYVEAGKGKFVFKAAAQNEMNHPEAEPEICNFLLERGIPVSEFQKNREGKYVSHFENERVGHLQKFVDGSTFAMNQAEGWFMEASSILLAKIHKALEDYPELPVGIGMNFFRYMTPERAMQSYQQSLEKARKAGAQGVASNLETRMAALKRVWNWQFDLSRLTVRNTHGDYTVSQILHNNNKIQAVIDWTSACRHPVIWELTRSFFYAEATCADGKYVEKRLNDYIEGYCTAASLTQYDRDNLLKLYIYQLAVCDYYAQYFEADVEKKADYLQQAEFATKVLKQFFPA